MVSLLQKTLKDNPEIFEKGIFLNARNWFIKAGSLVNGIVGATQSGVASSRQDPDIIGLGDFNIGMVDKSILSKIKIESKPVFSQCNFQNNDPQVAVDNMQLNDTLARKFLEMISKERESRISFNPFAKPSDAYTLSGRYTVEGNLLTVTVKLWHNDTLLDTFVIPCDKNNKNKLAEKIIVKATGRIFNSN